jgi:hypothetical protein
MAKARKAGRGTAKRTAGKRTVTSAKLKGRKVSRAKAPRTKVRKKGLSGVVRSVVDAMGEAKSLRSRLTGPDSFEDR